MPTGYKNPFPPIFDICHCKNHCGEIVYNGKLYVNGHNSIGRYPSIDTKKKMSENCSMKRPEVAARFKGDNNYNHNRIFSEDERKKNSEAQKEWHRTHEHPRGMKGKHHTKEFKQEQSDRNSGLNNPMYGKPPPHSKGSWYESSLQGQVHLRSTYELAYVKCLDSIDELWMYEIETFELLDEMTYTPDFFLPRLEKFIEVKGWMSPNSKLKISKFQEEYPFDLEVLIKQDLINLGCDIK